MHVVIVGHVVDVVAPTVASSHHRADTLSIGHVHLSDLNPFLKVTK